MPDAPIVESSGIWKTKALERHIALRLDYRRMLGWYDIVASVANANWTATQTATSSRPGSILADVHPLYRFLNEGTDTALIQISELGLYLEAFRDDPAYLTIATDLISPKFASTMFELAMAFRWRRAGGQVQLQPSAAAGRIADFSATISDIPFLAEASSIPAETYEALSFRVPLLIKRTASSYLKDDSVLVVKIHVRAVPQGMWEQGLVGAIKNCCHAVSGTGRETRRPASTEVHGLRIDVERFSPGEVPDVTQEDPWDVRADQIDEEKPHKLLLRTLVRFPSGEIEYAPRIIKKLIREMKQLSGVRCARVVLLDVTGVEPNALELRTDELSEGLRREITKQPALASVWLVSRIWTTEMRYAYWGLYVPNPNSTYQLPQTFLDRFVLNERSWDFLSETEIRHTTEEAARRSFLGRQPTFDGYIDRWQ